MDEPHTRELWWRGVAARNRGAVWARAIGNDLGLSPASFDAALARANEVERRLEGVSGEEVREAGWFGAIRRDADAVFPELGVFGKDGPLRDGLVDVLRAYAVYRADVGYVHGTQVFFFLSSSFSRHN